MVSRTHGFGSERSPRGCPGRIFDARRNRFAGRIVDTTRRAVNTRGSATGRIHRRSGLDLMSFSVETELQSFVLLRLGERRFAFAARQIAELVAPTRVFRFPHRTSEIEGVILRRGRIVPVCDVSETLIGKSLKSRRLYLIVVRRYESQSEWVALPVTG